MKCLMPLAAALLASAIASADVVRLKNGGSLEGQVVELDNEVIIKLPVGEVRVSRDAVAAIEKKPGALDEYLKRAAKIKDDDPDAHYQLGLVQRNSGNLEEAEREFLRASELDPECALAHLELGNILRRQGRLQDATARYRRALDLDGSLLEAQKALGAVLIELGEPAEAAVVDLECPDSVRIAHYCGRTDPGCIGAVCRGV